MSGFMERTGNIDFVKLAVRLKRLEQGNILLFVGLGDCESVGIGVRGVVVRGVGVRGVVVRGVGVRGVGVRSGTRQVGSFFDVVSDLMQF
jgi:hypothetical protein